MWVCRCRTVILFIGFRVSDLDDNAVSIKHIKYMFVSMLHQISEILGILGLPMSWP